MTDLGMPGSTTGGPVLTLDLPGHRLRVFSFGLACCAVELVAAAMATGDDLAERPEHADVMVVAGTVTDAMAPSVLALYEAMPEPRYVISFGACSNTGGPYWDSYCVTKGVDQLIPVDVYVPGCPPRPEALLDGLRELQRTLRP